MTAVRNSSAFYYCEQTTEGPLLWTKQWCTLGHLHNEAKPAVKATVFVRIASSTVSIYCWISMNTKRFQMWDTHNNHIGIIYPSSLSQLQYASTVCRNCLWIIWALGCGAVSSYHDVSQHQHIESQLQWTLWRPWLRGKHLPAFFCFQRAHSYITGNAGGGHLCVELVGAGDHPEGEDIPPGATQPCGFHGHLRRDGGRSGHAAQPRPWAQRPAVETGPGALPGVDFLRRALLHSQHLERYGHRSGPLLVHHQAPGVHAQDAQKDLQRDDRTHVAAVLHHFPVASFRLGGDLHRGDEVPGEPGPVLHHLLHLRSVLSATLCGSLCLLEDLQGCQVSDWFPQDQHNNTHGWGDY